MVWWNWLWIAHSWARRVYRDIWADISSWYNYNVKIKHLRISKIKLSRHECNILFCTLGAGIAMFIDGATVSVLSVGITLAIASIILLIIAYE